MGLIFLLGGGFLGMYAAYFIGTDPSVWFVLSGLLIPVLISLFLIGIGVWIVIGDLDGRYVLLISEWSLMATMTFFGFGLLNIVFQRTAGGVVAFPLFSTITTAATGLPLDMIIGIHDSRRKLNPDRVEAARDRAERLGQRLTVLNRVLRHDTRNAVNVIRGHAEWLLEGEDDVESSARTVLAKADEMHRLSKKARLLERMLERGDETELEHTSGLWLVRWIVRESGGDIEFEENDPRGSVVSIRLPREAAPEA